MELFALLIASQVCEELCCESAHTFVELCGVVFLEAVALSLSLECLPPLLHILNRTTLRFLYHLEAFLSDGLVLQHRIGLKSLELRAVLCL